MEKDRDKMDSAPHGGLELDAGEVIIPLSGELSGFEAEALFA